MPAPAPAPHPPAAPGDRLTHPQAANDLLMYRLNRLLAVAGSLVVRLCEGGYGITRREWGLLLMLSQIMMRAMRGMRVRTWMLRL